jgi:biotin transport system substrate-specific component
LARGWFGVVGFALLTALFAQVRVGAPVPMTLQTLGVLLAGYFLSPRVAAGSMLLYVFVGGVLHWPVFALSSGLGGLGGATGGYLLAFAPAAWLVSRLRGAEGASWKRLALAGLAGTTLVFAGGVAWLAHLIGDWGAAVSAGLVPFLPGAVVKLALVLSVVHCARRLRPRARAGRAVGEAGDAD